MHEVTFERIVPGGSCIGEVNNRRVYVMGVFPGETAKVQIVRSNKKYDEGVLVEILKPSVHRRKEQESHYMSCSPWQTVNYDYQVELKKEILESCFKNQAHEIVSITSVINSDHEFEYRNKIEYSFMSIGLELKLAIHVRGNSKEKVVMNTGCILGDSTINEYALSCARFLSSHGIKSSILKGLTVRKSVSSGELFGIVFVRERSGLAWDFFNDFEYENICIAYCDDSAPVRRFDSLLFVKGSTTITEIMGDKSIGYGLTSFFQNNIPVFQKALACMDAYVPPQSQRIVDLYCGVGVIGMRFLDKAQEMIGVEILKENVLHLERNILANKISNYRVVHSSIERSSGFELKDTDLVIVDPPRSGLHKKVINVLLEKKPMRVLYISCNPVTQARDYNLLKETYTIEALHGIDMYPNTPHIESLLVLNRS